MPQPITTSPSQIAIDLSTGQSVNVRQMRWPQARVFLHRLSALGGQLGSSMGSLAGEINLAEVGRSVIQRLPELIATSTEMSELLVAGCVAEISDGKLKLEDLSVSDFARLLDASVSVTLTPETMLTFGAVSAPS